MSAWCKENYDDSFTRNCFSFTPFCGSVGWEATWGEGGPALKENAQIRRLVEMEYAIRPVPLWAQQLARQIDWLPPCGWGFGQHVEAVCTNIGRQDPEALNALRCYAVGPGRLAIMSDVALLLDGWLKRVTPNAVARTVARRDTTGMDWPTIAQSVWRALGQPDARKELLVRRLLERLRFWLRAPYPQAKTDDNHGLGYLYVPEMGRYGGWDYFGFDLSDATSRDLDGRIREEIDTPDRWLDMILSTWPCAPKIMRFLERIICTIGRIAEGGTSSSEELSQSLPDAGAVLPVAGTFLDTPVSRLLYDTSIRALGDYAGSNFVAPMPLPEEVDVTWAGELTSALGEPDAVKLWLAALLLERIALFAQQFRTFHFTRNINHGYGQGQ